MIKARGVLEHMTIRGYASAVIKGARTNFAAC